MKRVFLLLFLLVFTVSIIWFFNQSISEGYVITTSDSQVWVIDVNDAEIEGKTKKEIMTILETKASESKGAFYDIPFINNILNTKFEKGQKVKIYWTGFVLQSAPGQIKDTLFIQTK